ncbi:MAG: hypothetical protein ACK56I_14270, partial [bacterium]
MRQKAGWCGMVERRCSAARTCPTHQLKCAPDRQGQGEQREEGAQVHEGPQVSLQQHGANDEQDATQADHDGREPRIAHAQQQEVGGHVERQQQEHDGQMTTEFGVL